MIWIEKQVNINYKDDGHILRKARFITYFDDIKRTRKYIVNTGCHDKWVSKDEGNQIYRDVVAIGKRNKYCMRVNIK